MNTVRELHRKAMKLAQLALIARNSGELERAQDLTRQASEYEAQAVNLIPDDESAEPTHAILYLSAASLAYQCKEFDRARQFIDKGLMGKPTLQVEQELLLLSVKVKEDKLQLLVPELEACGLTMAVEDERDVAPHEERKFADKTLVCRDCLAQFVFTAGEQEFFRSRGLENEPGRCAECRSARRQGSFGASKRPTENKKDHFKV